MAILRTFLQFLLIGTMIPAAYARDPDAVTITNGRSAWTAFSTERVIFSPTTAPIEAMMKYGFITASTTRRPRM